jgi:hypothetical protein
MTTPSNTYWTTRDNRKLLIADMDIDHVYYCIHMLIRKHGHDGVMADKCCWRQRLVDLIIYQEQKALLVSLTDPNR